MLSLTYFLSKLNNAIRQQQLVVCFPYSNICFQVALLLQKEGFLKRVQKSQTSRFSFWVVLRSQKNVSAIRKIHQYSTCSRSIHWRLQDFPHDGFYLLSTAQGILSKKEAFQKQVGGKVLFRVF